MCDSIRGSRSGEGEGGPYVPAMVLGAFVQTWLRGEMGTGLEEMSMGNVDTTAMRQRVREGLEMSMLAKMS